MNTKAGAARHVATTAGQAEQALQVRDYQNPSRTSRASLLMQEAEDVLTALVCTLQASSHLSALERQCGWVVFESLLSWLVSAKRRGPAR